jgi:RNA polymerase sigma-70 factor (ECF subfamily)
VSEKLEIARAAAEGAFRDHAGAILTFCRRRLSDRSAAEDVAQEAFARLWATLAAGTDVRNPRAFLYTVAGNLIKNHIRDRKPVDSLERLAEDGFEPADGTADTARQAREESLRATIESILGPEDAAILSLRYVEELPLAEVAAAVGMSRIAVSVRIHRALKKLKPHFHED